MQESVLQHVRSAVYAVDASGAIVYWNRHCEQLYGWRADEIINRPVLDVLMPDGEAGTAAAIRRALAAQGYWEGEVLTQRKLGPPLPTLLSLATIVDDGGTVSGVAGVAQDLTPQKQAEQAWRESEARFRALIHNVSDIIGITDVHGFIRYVNPAVERLLGVPPHSFEQTRFMDWLLEDDVESAITWFRQAPGRRDGADAAIFRLRHRDGTYRRLELLASDRLDDAAVRGIVITCRDVTERERLHDELQYRAFYDLGTGLPNRALFTDRLAQALVAAQRRKTSIGVLFLDLDGFKAVNDNLGHAAGDQLLATVAARLQMRLGMQDTAARFGGDEFTVLLEDLGATQSAVAIAEQLRAAITAPIAVAGQEITVRVSIGVTVRAPQSSPAQADDLLREADIALRQAKKDGKDRVVLFDAQMALWAQTQLRLERDLRSALERDELRVFYQPQIDLKTGAIDGAEALVRWQHPSRGLLPPSEFIPLAEETGLVIELDRWVLARACRDAAGWQPLSPDASAPSVSVNLSGRQFQRPGLVETVAAVLTATGLEPGRLCLEVTETALMTDIEEGIRVLLRLRALGVLLAIDDFGTGYASLSYLRRLPVDTIKIDRSFITGLAGSPRALRIVRAVTHLARTVGMDVTAEGVETVEELKMTRSLRCHRAQGYLFARPLPHADFLALLAAPPIVFASNGAGRAA
jgi:diguanylate cyclase (GGDEF)-like protein/PAS domain S-box-containing protein